MTIHIYPSNLPGPKAASTEPFDGRRLSISTDIFDASELSSDKLYIQSLDWVLGSDISNLFYAWWKDTIDSGGCWFKASWPSPKGFQAFDRLFIVQPTWSHLGGGVWSASAKCVLRMT